MHKLSKNDHVIYGDAKVERQIGLLKCSINLQGQFRLNTWYDKPSNGRWLFVLALTAKIYKLTGHDRTINSAG